MGVDVNTVTLIRMDGKYKTISYKPYPQAGEFLKKANIQVLNLKSRYNPFTIVQDDDVRISPYYGPAIDSQYLQEHVFVGWPRGREWQSSYTVALMHVVDWKFHERSKNTLTTVYLIGMNDAVTDQAKADALVSSSRSWLRPPDLKLTSDGYKFLGYDRKKKAYVIQKVTLEPLLGSCQNADDTISAAGRPWKTLRNFDRS